MLKNSKGFTMVELLASLVILGLLMLVAVPNVTGILNQNRITTYVEDAKKLATTAEYKFRGDTTLVKPTVEGQCIAASLKYLDNSEFENPPYDGEYMENESFIIMKKVSNGYEYYVQLIERMPQSRGYHGVTLVNVNKLYKDDYNQYVKNFTIANVPVLESDSSAAALQTYSSSVASCGSIIRVYAVAG